MPQRYEGKKGTWINCYLLDKRPCDIKKDLEEVGGICSTPRYFSELTGLKQPECPGIEYIVADSEEGRNRTPLCGLWFRWEVPPEESKLGIEGDSHNKRSRKS